MRYPETPTRFAIPFVAGALVLACAKTAPDVAEAYRLAPALRIAEVIRYCTDE